MILFCNECRQDDDLAGLCERCTHNLRVENDLLAEIERLRKANEEIRKESGCPPDCDLLSWIKMLNRMYEVDCNKEGKLDT